MWQDADGGAGVYQEWLIQSGILEVDQVAESVNSLSDGIVCLPGVRGLTLVSLLTEPAVVVAE